MDNQSKKPTIGIALEPEVFEALDKAREQLAREHGVPVTRSAFARKCLEDGLGAHIQRHSVQ